MDKRNNRRLIAGVVALTLGLFAATLYAARGRRVAIDIFPFAWENEVVVDFDDDSDGGNHRTPDPDPDPNAPPPVSVSVPIPLPAQMTLNIGGQPFNLVYINQNGFISLTYQDQANGEVTGTPELFEAPGPRSFDDLTGNVIAPFYADATTVAPGVDCHDNGANQFENCNVAYSFLLPERAPTDPDVPPPYDRGMRITWGYGAEGGAPDGLAENGGDPALRNRFQMKLLALGAESGDFDIEFNYDDIRWEKPLTAPAPQPRTLVGLKAGGKVLDFSKFFSTFVLDTALPLPPACTGVDDLDALPSFERTTPLLCNIITIRVRNGIPKLVSYTSDVSVGLTAGGAGPVHTTETFGLGVQLLNGDDDPATNVTVALQLPKETTIVAAPQGVTCTAGTGSAVCNFGALEKGQARTSVLNVRSMQDGARTYSAEVTADQYDFDELDNKTEVQLSLAPSADVAVTTCTAPSPITQGTGMVVQCTVRNNGPQGATNVAMTTDLPAFVTFVSGSGCVANAARVTCTAPTLANNATTTFALTLNTPSTGTATVSATVSAAENDPLATNNTAGAPVTISAPPVVVDPRQPKKGGGALSIWLLLSLALLGKRQRSATSRDCGMRGL